MLLVAGVNPELDFLLANIEDGNAGTVGSSDEMRWGEEAADEVGVSFPCEAVPKSKFVAGPCLAGLF